jgi:malonyl-CoA O-methyltransferase
MTIDKNQVARQFSRAALDYDDFAVVQKEMAELLLAKIDDSTTGRLIDLGCGTGHALAEIQRRTKLNLTGVDIAPGMIELAKSRVPDANFLVADLENLPIEQQVFDVVFSTATLQWCDAAVALNEMKRVMAPNGRLLLSTFGEGTLREWDTAWATADSRHRRVHSFPEIGQIMECLTLAGFRSIEIQQQPRTIIFDSIDLVIESIKRIGATYAGDDRSQRKLTRRTYQRFRDCLLENYGERPQLSYNCILAVARG